MPPIKKRSRVDERPDDVDESQDAPTVQLSLFSDNNGDNSENVVFAQLGSVTSKLESFNALAQRKVKTLSTVPSESGAILPTSFASKSVSSTPSIKDLRGIATRVMLESSSSKELNSRHNMFFDHFNYHYFSSLANTSFFHEAICSFAVSSTEQEAQWGVIRIPGSFDSCTTILLHYSGEEPVLYVSFEGGDILTSLAAFGVEFEEIFASSDDVVEDTADSPSSESVCHRREEFCSSLKITGKSNVFGFFDFLRNHNGSSSREISICASFPFTHAKYRCAKICVYKSATSFSGNIAQIDNISIPLSVLDSIVGMVDSDVKATITIDRKTRSCFSTRRPRDNDDQVIHLVRHNHI